MRQVGQLPKKHINSLYCSWTTYSRPVTVYNQPLRGFPQFSPTYSDRTHFNLICTSAATGLTSLSCGSDDAHNTMSSSHLMPNHFLLQFARQNDKTFISPEQRDMFTFNSRTGLYCVRRLSVAGLYCVRRLSVAGLYCVRRLSVAGLYCVRRLSVAGLYCLRRQSHAFIV